MFICGTWVLQISGALFHETLVKFVVLVIRKYIFFYHRRYRSLVGVIFDKMITADSFGNRGVSIVLNLIGSIHDMLGNGKRSKPSLLKFLASCKVFFVIFVEYVLCHLKMVTQIEAIAISMSSCCLFSESFEGK